MDFKNSPNGQVIQTQKGYSAFIPNPLPPKIEWGDSLANALARANFLLGKLSKEGSLLPNPHMLIRPFITKEAVLSSRIEGTHTTLGEILANDASNTIPCDLEDLQEVRNYIVALDYGLERLGSLPLSIRLIRELHEKLMAGVRGKHATPGEFRRSQNWIGPPGRTLATAKYIPPPPEEMLDALSAFESFLHNRTLPPLVHIALCHYQFEAIHPFLDGNGRVGRLLITLLLIEHQLLCTPLLYLSAFFEATRRDYYDHLYYVSRNGAWEEWLVYFLNGVAVQSEDALSRAQRINGLLNQWKEDVKGNTNLTKIIEHFAANPYLTARKIESDLGISYSTSQRGIAKLQTMGMIDPITSRKRDKIYCATKIFKILEEPTTIDEKDY